MSPFLKDNSIGGRGDVQPPETPKRALHHLFPRCGHKFDWVRDPFHCDTGAADLPATAVEQLIELSYDKTHQGLRS